MKMVVGITGKFLCIATCQLVIMNHFYHRFCHSARNWWLYKHSADYYPITMVKTANLDPDKTYLLGYHPHGILRQDEMLKDILKLILCKRSVSIVQLRCTVLLRHRRHRLLRQVPRAESPPPHAKGELLPSRGTRVRSRVRPVLGH